jgi:PAS domain S-box-containing protein
VTSEKETGMDSPVRILHLEDDPADAELVRATLEGAGIACQTTRVETGGEFRQALAEGGYDTILADYRLPAYDGVSALQLTRELRPDVPFIFVSGAMGEDAAIEALTGGATDYVLKHKLSRVVPAVKRALREAENARERKRAEANIALRNFALDNVQESAFLIGEDARLYYVNEGACRTLGYTREELLGMRVADIAPDFPAERWARHWNELKSRRSLTFEGRHRTKDGRVLPVEISDNYFEYDGRGHAMALVRDITERKRAEEKLQQMELQLAHVARLSTMGEMVAGIAHELNQPLYAILNYAKAARNFLAAKGADELEPLCEWSEEIADTARWAADVVKRLRSFARRTDSERSRCRINHIVRESLGLVDFAARRAHVVLEAQLCPESPVVWADRVELQQVLVNLLQNALEAMQDTMPEKRRVTVQTAVAAGAIEFSVADHGVGLPVGDHQSLFDPFVTTKPGGLGMGLAISKTILEAHGGRLWAVPKPAGGATFHGTLPLVDEIQTDAD